jgi:GxxExxY protein
MTGLTLGSQSSGTRQRHDDDPTTSQIIAAAIEVHRILGPGLLEAVYEECLCHEFQLRGIPFERQVSVPVLYKGAEMQGAIYRLDIVVENQVILEIKAVEEVLRVHKAQLLSYLRVTGKPRGLLINFNVPYLSEGITRVVNSKPMA